VLTTENLGLDDYLGSVSDRPYKAGPSSPAGPSFYLVGGRPGKYGVPG
jgi:hypothetical protein